MSDVKIVPMQSVRDSSTAVNISYASVVWRIPVADSIRRSLVFTFIGAHSFLMFYCTNGEPVISAAMLGAEQSATKGFPSVWWINPVTYSSCVANCLGAGLG